MSKRLVIFTLLMDEPPNGKLPVLGVHSFAFFFFFWMGGIETRDNYNTI